MKKAAAVIAIMMTVVLFAAPEDVIGTWYTKGNNAKVKIRKNGNTYTGSIIWLKDPVYDDDHESAGQPKLDDNNPDTSLRSRKIVGMQFLWGFTYENGEYTGGKIYDPESGKTYHCKMEIKDGKLHVRGSLDRFGLAGRTQEWTRATD